MDPNSPWRNRCGLTSGNKKSLVIAKNKIMVIILIIGGRNIKEICKGTCWTQENSLRYFEVYPSKKKKRKKKKKKNTQQDQCPQNRAWKPLSTYMIYPSLSGFPPPLFFFSSFELPDTILFNPRLGSDCSATPSSLSFPTPPHNN